MSKSTKELDMLNERMRLLCIKNDNLKGANKALFDENQDLKRERDEYLAEIDELVTKLRAHENCNYEQLRVQHNGACIENDNLHEEIRKLKNSSEMLADKNTKLNIEIITLNNKLKRYARVIDMLLNGED